MNPEEEAMEILMMFGKDGCTIADSGGKDSSVLKRVAEKCREKYGLHFKVVHNHTGLDAPETVYYVRSEKERLEKAGIEYMISYPNIYFDRLCFYNGMLPTRLARFCCKELKESYGKRERLVTGVRKDESTNRKHNQGVVTVPQKTGIPEEVKSNENFLQTDRGGVVLLNYDNSDAVEMVYTCLRTNKVLVNPLINWSDDDVWKYIRDEHIDINPIYECGFSRVGCIGCPMATYKGRTRQFERYPKFRERYINIADKIVKANNEKGVKKQKSIHFENGLDYFRHWIEDPNVKGQLSFDMDGNITEDYT